MIHPKRFYSRADEPTQSEKEEVWSLLHRNIHPGEKKPFLLMRDRRSFLFGAAAMLAVMLVSAASWIVYQNVLEKSRSPQARLSRAYEDVLVEFDRALPALLVSSSTDETQAGVVSMRRKQLNLLDESIGNIRSQLRADPQNAILKVQLLQLYNLKLQFLVQMATSTLEMGPR